jgi:hypothetical protein
MLRARRYAGRRVLVDQPLHAQSFFEPNALDA